MKCLLSVLLILGMASLSMAHDFPEQLFGNQVGNGGKGVVCRDKQNQIKSVQLLDFYEASVLGRGMPRYSGKDYSEMATNAIDRLKTIDPQKFILYRSEWMGFENNRAFIRAPIIETPDSDHIIAPPPGCTIEQLAIQITPAFPQDRRYNINEMLWQKMSETNRAGLILHEIIFREAIARGHKNSIAVRYLNAVIASGEIARLSAVEYGNMIHEAHLATLRWTHVDQWALVDTIGMGWEDAKKACNYLERGVLPSKIQLQNTSQDLRTSLLVARIMEESIPESWMFERDQASGLIPVANWQGDIVQFYLRPAKDSAQVLCVSKKTLKEML